jgi:type II secretory pathway component PulM
MNSLRDALITWWRSRLPGERQVLTAGGTVLVLLLWVFVLIMPLRASVNRLATELPQLRETNAALDAMAREASDLQLVSNSTPIAADQREGAVRRSLARAALADPKSIEVTLQDASHLRVRCDDVDYGLWLAWLHGARADVGANVESATVTARAANGIAGRVHADVVLTWPPSGDANS